MKLVEMRCKNCGAVLNVVENQSIVQCQYCQSIYQMDKEVQYVFFKDMKQYGYDFEKGRIRVQ